MGAWTWGICSIPQFMVILKGDGFSQSFVVCLSQCLEKATVRYVWVVFGAQDLSYILPGVPQPITKSRWGSGDASVTSEKSRKGLSFQVIWIPQNLGWIIVFFAKEAIRILDAGRLVTYIYIYLYIYIPQKIPSPSTHFDSLVNCGLSLLWQAKWVYCSTVYCSNCVMYHYLTFALSFCIYFGDCMGLLHTYIHVYVYIYIYRCICICIHVH